MPIRRLESDPGRWVVLPPCNSTDHSPPPSTEHLEPGWYEHTCPSCKSVTIFNISPGMRRG